MDEDGPREKALVVDDDVAIRLLLTRVLQREKFEVDTAKDGIEAVEKMRFERYAVVFLDLMMPRLDGLGVLRYLRANHPEALKSVIVVSAFHSISPEVFEDMAVARVLSKPFDIQDLVSDTRRMIDEIKGTQREDEDVQPS
jgi:DNA-binding response OmpR family regulator